MKKIDYEKATFELAGCVIWALKFMTAPGGGTVFDSRTGSLRSWEGKFMDALDSAGYVVDREKFFSEKRSKRGGKRKAKEKR